MHVRLTNMKNDRLTKCIYKHSNRSPTSIDQQTLKLFKQYEINCNFKTVQTKIELKKQLQVVRKMVDGGEQQKWLDKLWDDTKNIKNGNKLRLYRQHKDCISTEQYIEQNMSRKYRQMLAKLRSGSLPIRVETGRYDNTPLEDRICNCCSANQIEDEVHILLQCDLYNDLRYKLLKHMLFLNDAFNTLSPLDKFISIMKTKSAQYMLAKYIFDMFKRRKIHDMV